MSRDDIVLDLIEKLREQLYEVEEYWGSDFMDMKERYALAADVASYAEEIRDEIRFLWKKEG